jgi:RNA polymerase subunit RPABC4/transcription elongation factor Spt4
MVFCPNCGTEHDSGRKCPECGLVDEECSRCGSMFTGGEWMCSSCGRVRSFCPDCGAELNEGTCPDCGAQKPASCAECQSLIDADVDDCPECGYNPGSTRRTVGTVFQGISLLVFVYGVYETVTAYTAVSAQTSAQTAAGFAAVVGTMSLGFALTLFAGGWLAKRSGRNQSPVT